MEKIWLKSYPPGVPAEIDVNEFRSLGDLFDRSVKRFADKTAYICMGKSMTYAELLSLIHISEPTRLLSNSYAVFCLNKNTVSKTVQGLRPCLSLQTCTPVNAPFTTTNSG